MQDHGELNERESGRPAGDSTEAPRISPPRSRIRRLALPLIAILVGYAVTELLVFTATSIRFGRVFSFSEFAVRPREVTAGMDPFRLRNTPARIRVRKEIVHPYLGYVYDPTVEESSPFGISDVSPVQRRSADKVIVGVFGGSFANDLAYHSEDGGLAEQLKPYFPDHRRLQAAAATDGAQLLPRAQRRVRHRDQCRRLQRDCASDH
jgi:hypothetical protein